MSEPTAESEQTKDLVRRLRQGERSCLDQLLEAHAPYLRRVVGARLGPDLRRRMDPSDVVQATQVDALERIDGFLDGEPMPFRWWLRRIAQNQVRRIWRRHVGAAKRDVRREVPLPDESSLQLFTKLAARGGTPSQQVAKRETATRVRQALAQLDETNREVLLMRYFEDMPYEEIGYVLGISSGAARGRHGRAMLRLIGLLRDLGLSESMA